MSAHQERTIRTASTYIDIREATTAELVPQDVTKGCDAALVFQSDALHSTVAPNVGSSVRMRCPARAIRAGGRI